MPRTRCIPSAPTAVSQAVLDARALADEMAAGRGLAGYEARRIPETTAAVHANREMHAGDPRDLARVTDEYRAKHARRQEFPMTTYVLIPGACHGGWCFDDLAAALRAEGHLVLTPTLTGVAERAHLAHAGVNLETHIADVIAEMRAHHVTDAVLAGHSYGGMVITAVADRIPQQVDSLVYLDGFVPRDGDSC